ncbi:unnamed protein product [Cuscuta epithymum]|uniref:Uncharacterized protein n=1 Tax=Cuscuta epithymum TaxID=186058 RepID=A0AAV0G242_9ASTE|nr:unnamed protein product [Cuscuta epithymum]
MTFSGDFSNDTATASLRKNIVELVTKMNAPPVKSLTTTIVGRNRPPLPATPCLPAWLPNHHHHIPALPHHSCPAPPLSPQPCAHHFSPAPPPTSCPTPPECPSPQPPNPTCSP